MRNFLMVAALLGLGAAGASPAKITAQSIIVNPVQSDLSVSAWTNRDPSGKTNPTYTVGDRLSVSVQVSQDAYVYLFNVNADGKIDLISPNGYEDSNFVSAGTVRTFPPSQANYQFTVAGPNGQDKILALASLDQLTLDQIATFAGDQSFAQVGLQGQDNLARALSVVVEPVNSTDWSTDTVYFQVAGGNAGSGAGNQTDGNPADVNAVRPGEFKNGRIDAAISGAYDRVRGDLSLGAPQDRDNGRYVYRWGNGYAQDFAGVRGYGDGTTFHADGSSRAYPVHADILKRYLQLANTENGASAPPRRLGWPAGDEKVIGRNRFGTNGLYGFFQNGAIYSTDKYGTFVLTGDVLKLYQGLGGSGSSLGFPNRDQFVDVSGHGQASFEGGTIRWSGGKYRIFRK